MVHLPNGAYGLIEVKIGGKHLIEEGAKTLNRLTNLIAAKKMKPPAFCMVLTATGELASTREDGIVVCPLSALKP